jgi:hypothetical protein
VAGSSCQDHNARRRPRALCAFYAFTKLKAIDGPVLEGQDLEVRLAGWSLARMHVWNGSNWPKAVQPTGTPLSVGSGSGRGIADTPRRGISGLPLARRRKPRDGGARAALIVAIDRGVRIAGVNNSPPAREGKCVLRHVPCQVRNARRGARRPRAPLPIVPRVHEAQRKLGRAGRSW